MMTGKVNRRCGAFRFQAINFSALGSSTLERMLLLLLLLLNTRV
jgi:hypothetical protein